MRSGRSVFRNSDRSNDHLHETWKSLSRISVYSIIRVYRFCAIFLIGVTKKLLGKTKLLFARNTVQKIGLFENVVNGKVKLKYILRLLVIYRYNLILKATLKSN